MTTEQAKFDSWAIVELLGRSVIAGRVTEEAHVGTILLRVDVPEMNGQQPFTKLYGAAAIYSITPCSEEAARAVQEYKGQQPINVYVPQLEAPRRSVQPARSYSPPEYDERPSYQDDYREHYERDQSAEEVDAPGEGGEVGPCTPDPANTKADDDLPY